MLTRLYFQLTRNDPEASKPLNQAALGLAIYGAFIFVFWCVVLMIILASCKANSMSSLGFNIYQVVYPAQK